MTALKIIDTDSSWEVFLFVGDNAISMAGCVIVVVCNLIAVRFSDDAGTAVKVDCIRAIFVNHFKNLISPCCIKFVIWIAVWQIAVRLKRKGRTIINFIFRIVDVSLIVCRHKPSPQPLMVECGNQFNIALSKGFCTLTKDIAVRTTIDTVDWIHRAVPHREVIGMLGDRAGIACSAFDNQIGPFFRIEGFSFHHWDKVFVTEIVQ